MTQTDTDCLEVIRRERLLLDPGVRADGELVADLLHPDFVEHGASGRVWARDSIIAALADDPRTTGEAAGFEAVRLADDVVLLTYRVLGETGSLRSSVWVREQDEWLVRFHQGTRVRVSRD